MLNAIALRNGVSILQRHTLVTQRTHHRIASSLVGAKIEAVGGGIRTDCARRLERRATLATRTIVLLAVSILVRLFQLN